MAQLSDTRRQIEAPFMNEFWKLRKEYGEPEDREAYWAYLISGYKDSQGEHKGYLIELSEKHERDPFTDNLLLAFVDDIDGRFNGKSAGEITLNFFNLLRTKRGLPKVAEVKT